MWHLLKDLEDAAKDHHTGSVLRNPCIFLTRLDSNHLTHVLLTLGSDGHTGTHIFASRPLVPSQYVMLLTRHVLPFAFCSSDAAAIPISTCSYCVAPHVYESVAAARHMALMSTAAQPCCFIDPSECHASAVGFERTMWRCVVMAAGCCVRFTRSMRQISSSPSRATLCMTLPCPCCCSMPSPSIPQRILPTGCASVRGGRLPFWILTMAWASMTSLVLHR